MLTHQENPKPISPRWPRRAPFLRRLERLTAIPEKPLYRVVKTGLLSPLYATGPIAVFLLIVIGVTGIYITLFYDFSFERSYDAVARMNQLGVSRLMRAIHRYASDIFIITVLLHALRTFLTGRFRRPYWLAWTTGWVMLALAIAGGVTGYWLIWDDNAQILTLMLLRFLAAYVPGGERLAVLIIGLGPRRASWAFMLTLFVLHVLAFISLGAFIWLHVRRLQKPQYFPRPYWTPLVFAALLIGGVVLPAYLLQKATFTRAPAWVRVDLLYLAIVPPWLRGWAAPFLGVSLVALAALMALPWLSSRPAAEPQVTIVDEKCTGCHLCALDCPYKAIRMVERSGPYKYLAVVDPAKCVSCSICLGSCDDDALLWGGLSAREMAAAVARQVAEAREAHPAVHLKAVFACERHLDQGAEAYEGQTVPVPGGAGNAVMSVVGVRCAGALHPGVLTAALDAGADEVVVVGCPPDDCAHRQGNLWLQARLERERAPRLDKAYANAAIRTAWVAPGMFLDAVRGGEDAATWSDVMVASEKTVRVLPAGGWRALLAAAVVLIVPLLVLVGLAHRTFAAYPEDTAYLLLAVEDPLLLRPPVWQEAPPASPVYFVVRVDGEPRYRRAYTPTETRRGDALFRLWPLPPGRHHVRLAWEDAQGRLIVPVLDWDPTFGPRGMVPIYLGRY